MRQGFISRFRLEDAARLIDGDWDRMVTFYQYPKEHWVHLRTTNRIAVFAPQVANRSLEALQVGRERKGADLEDDAKKLAQPFLAGPQCSSTFVPCFASTAATSLANV